MGLGRSLALPGLRLRVENPVQVCSWTFPLTPDPSPPFPGARGGFSFSVGSWWRREVFFESRHRQCHPSLLLGARGSTDVFWDTFFSHAFDSVVGSARSIVTCTA
jgi:hypothetical protein